MNKIIYNIDHCQCNNIRFYRYAWHTILDAYRVYIHMYIFNMTMTVNYFFSRTHSSDFVWGFSLINRLT